MPAITQSQFGSRAKPIQTYFSSDNMLSGFDLLIKPQKESIFSISDTSNKLMLIASLDLSKHIAAISLDLLITYTFANLKKFCHVVASNKTCLLNLLAGIVNYNVSIYNKMLAEYSK